MKCLPIVMLCVCVATGMCARGDFADDGAAGIDMYIEACRWQGSNPSMIRTAYGEFEVTVTSPAQNEEAIQDRIDQYSDVVRDLIETKSDGPQKQQLEGVLKTLPDVVRARNTGLRRSRMKVLLSGNDVTFGKRRLEVVNFDPATEKWEQPLLALRRALNKAPKGNVLWDSSALLATVSSDGVDVPEFHQFGRMQGFASRLVTAALLDPANIEAFQFPPQNVARFKTQVEEVRRTAKLDSYRMASYRVGRRESSCMSVAKYKCSPQPPDAVVIRASSSLALNKLPTISQLLDSAGDAGECSKIT